MENIKQVIPIQVIFILENKFSPQIFYQNIAISLSTDENILNTC